MKNNFFKILILTLIVSLPFGVSAQISKIVFTTEEQHINPNELSGPITMQAQDSGGNPFQTPETIDLEFVSTSGTGEFLGSTGNPVTKTMSKNTSNRTFYYKDSTEGNFVLTVKATGRESGKTWEVSQNIFVGDSGSPAILSANTTSTQSTSSGGSSSYVSTQLGSTQNMVLDISAGADRLVTVGTPITFQANIKKNTVQNAGLDFAWSFGDANVGVGKMVTHTYKYPGDYVAVLRATAGDIYSISRVKVRVIEPTINLYEYSDYIELHNGTNQEINLFNWKLTSEGKGFVFQADTIILPNSKITVDRGMMRMKGEKDGIAKLFDANGNILSVATKTLSKNELKNIENELAVAWKEVDAVMTKAQALNLIKENGGMNVYTQVSSVAKSDILAPEVLGESIDFDNMNEEILYESPKKKSFVSNFFGFFVGLFR